MRKLIACLMAFVSLSIGGHAQVNLIKNPGFEIFSGCPSTGSQFERLSGWDTLRNGGGGDPWLITKCCTGYLDCQVPYNLGFRNGYQYPKTDSSYGAFCMYSNSTIPNREYIQNKLIAKLTSGKTYCLKYYINLNNCSEYAIDQIGAYFDNGSVFCSPWGICTVSPQIQTPPGVYYKDTVNWVQISGTYLSNGTEQYITLGNFKTGILTDTLNVNSNAPRVIAFYNIDDVSLIATDILAWAHNDTTICAGDSLMLGRMPEIGLDCTWLDTLGNILGNKANLWVKPFKTQKYIVRQDNCVTSYDTVTITVKPKLRNLVVSSDKNTVCADSIAQLNASVSGAGSGLSWQWFPTAGLSNANNPATSAWIQQSQTYTITLHTTAVYCPPQTLVDSIHINLKDCSLPFSVSVPNVFTPNGDGTGDFWLPIITNFTFLTSFHCAVFDRWGVKVFESEDAGKSWDGHTLTGTICQSGTYYYVLDITAQNGMIFRQHGFLELLR
jgi:gliding motility-associated-like protein